MNVSTLWRFLGLVPALVAGLVITPIAGADDRLNFNLDWGWAVKELSRMQSAVDRLDAGAGKTNPDEYKGSSILISIAKYETCSSMRKMVFLPLLLRIINGALTQGIHQLGCTPAVNINMIQ
jgi:hypothetical protein